MRGEVSFPTSREAEDQKHHLVNIYNREYTDPGSVLWSFSWKWEESKGVSMEGSQGKFMRDRDRSAVINRLGLGKSGCRKMEVGRWDKGVLWLLFYSSFGLLHALLALLDAGGRPSSTSSPSLPRTSDLCSCETRPCGGDLWHLRFTRYKVELISSQTTFSHIP